MCYDFICCNNYLWSRIEVVITRLTRNQFVGFIPGTRVRIPPAPVFHFLCAICSWSCWINLACSSIVLSFSSIVLSFSAIDFLYSDVFSWRCQVVWIHLCIVIVNGVYPHLPKFTKNNQKREPPSPQSHPGCPLSHSFIFHLFLLRTLSFEPNHIHVTLTVCSAQAPLRHPEITYLVLLHSWPDTVRKAPSRKTQTSTPLIKGSYTQQKPSV